MVSGRLSTGGVLRMALLALLALGTPGAGRAVPVTDPGPFWPLTVGPEGAPYADAFPAGARYSLRSGRLPQGLHLASDGSLSGSPGETGTFEATLDVVEATGRAYPLRTSLTVYRSDESDRSAAAPRFDAPGPYPTDVLDLVLDVTNTFDGVRVRTRVRVVRPIGAGGPRPLLLFHRGRGFDEDSYRDFHQHIASHGIAVASVEDAYSITGATFMAINTFYDSYRADLGMQSASGVVEAVADYLLDRSDDPTSPLAGSFDGEDLFFAGHSRGGGAVHASHQRSFELRLKGLIYLMAFDLRYFAEVAPPATAPAYPIFAEHPRTPCLIVAAENDGDLVYPIADQLIDRATGPATQVTVYGAVHNLISDGHPAEGPARISRAEEQAQVADWIVCFVKRWADQETDLDARLYGGAHQGSDAEAVTWWRPTDRTLLLEDAQDADPARNRYGDNLVANLRRREESIYPPVGDLPRLGLRHTLLVPTETTSVWRLASDGPLDASNHQRLVLRTAQLEGSRGWEDLAVWVRLIDAAGGASWQRVWDPTAGGLLPASTGLSPLDRFVEVELELAKFAASSGPPADLSQLRGVDLFLVRRSTRRVTVAVDAVRLE